MSIFRTEQIDEMLAKYALAGDQEQFMTDWLDETHGVSHMRWGEYLMFWAQAKEQYLTNLFGGKLIHKFPFSADKTEDDLRREFDYDRDFNEMLNYVMNRFEGVVELYAQKVLKMGYNNASHFWRACRNGWSDSAVRLIDVEDFGAEQVQQIRDFVCATEGVFDAVRFNYTYVRNACSHSARFTLPGCRKPFQMCEGQKPIKVLNAFFKYLQPMIPDADQFFKESFSGIEDLRLRQSQLLNTKNFHGKLCLSIHPMDYMTMSDNGCDWHSCMRWEDGAGEYHAGTLEMMTSPSVVVAYLESDKNWFPLGEADGRTWSNKKWRELFIVTPDFISGVKGYPYESDALENAVMAHLMDMGEAIGWDFDREIQRFDHDGRVDAPNGTSFYFGTEIMYNDTDYTVLPVAFKKGFDREYDDRRFFYGDGAFCIKCGKLRTSQDEEDYQDRLMCEDCDGVTRCAYCGDRHTLDDMVELPDGRMVCSYCYDEHFVTCQVSKEVGLDCDMETVPFRFYYVTPEGYHYDESFIVKEELVERLAEKCVERYSNWGDRMYKLVRPLPEDNDLCQKFMATIKEYIGEGDTMQYPGAEEDERNARAMEVTPSDPFLASA